MTGRVSLTTGTSEVIEDGVPWSLGMGKEIGDSTRMIEFKILGKLTSKERTLQKLK